MSRKDDEAVGLFIYMIRKIWDVYYKETGDAHVPWNRENGTWHAEVAPKVHDVRKNTHDTMRKRTGRKIKMKSGVLREPGPLRGTLIDNSQRRTKSTKVTSSDINYKDGVLFTKFKIRTNDCADRKKLKNNRQRQ
eukprot:jgi/Antlo1/1648/2271